jgi:hypothetical protein
VLCKIDIHPQQTATGLFQIDQFVTHAREGFLYQIKQTQSALRNIRSIALSMHADCAKPVQQKKNGHLPISFLSFQPLAAGPTKAAVDVTFVNYEIINDQRPCRNDRVRKAKQLLLLSDRKNMQSVGTRLMHVLLSAFLSSNYPRGRRRGMPGNACPA